MDIQQAIKKLRMFLADPSGLMWNDNELERLINTSLRQYSIDSGLFKGTFDLIPDEDGRYFYPDDFAGLLIAWNKDGAEIEKTTFTELAEYRGYNTNRTGNAVFIYSDISDNGEYKVYPVPANNQNTVEGDLRPVWGVLNNSGFGVADESDWGVTSNVTEYDFAGDCVYMRYASMDEVKDYMAVIYYAMYLAYLADSDFGNTQLAEVYRYRYHSRVNALDNVTVGNAGTVVNSKFY